MRKLAVLILLLLLALPCNSQWNYPPTKTVEASDIYFEKRYPDPYRWLENPKDKDVQAWFKAQAELTDGLLDRIPGREALAREWIGMDALKSINYGGIQYENGRIFYTKTPAGERTSKLFFREGWDGAEKRLFDPVECPLEFTAISSLPGLTTLFSFVPSWDGKHVCLLLTRGGAEYSEIRILDVDRATLLQESIHPSLHCYGWTPDGKAFFYDAEIVSDLARRDIKLNRKTRLHELGTDVATDRDILSNGGYPELGIAPGEIPQAYIDETCPDYILGKLNTTENELRFFCASVSELSHPKVKWNVLCKRSENLLQGPVFYGDWVYAVTHTEAPKGKLVRTSAKHPDWAHAETVIPEQADVLGIIRRSRHCLVIAYTEGVVCRLVKYNLETGAATLVRLPAYGTTPYRCMDWKIDRWLVMITSWTSPLTYYDFDARKDTFNRSIFDTGVHYPGFKDLVSEEIEVTGHDGTKIPLSIIRPKDLRFDGSNCCILEGFGAYGTSIYPAFYVFNSVASRNVVRAYAHVRGGGEKGEEWHKAGYRTTKPNTWKDFISCAEYLIQKGYTRPQKLAAIGSSAGGILISRAIEERPDLFAAAVCNVGLANPMRHEFTAGGPSNVPEFGTVKDPTECRALFEMDGVQHVQTGVKYPAVMGVGGWNDPRVPPWQPGKLVAALQAASTSSMPVLMKVNYDSGHGTGDRTAQFQDLAGQFAFLLWQTGHGEFQPENKSYRDLPQGKP